MKRLLLVLLAAALVWLAGCTLPATPRPCAPDELQSATITSPTMWEMVTTLRPTVTWTYPEGGDCQPASFRITLLTGPNLTETTYTVAGNVHEWTPPTDLPGAEYFIVGVASLPESGTGRGTAMINFFTPPLCDPADALVAPTLLTPNGATLSASGFDVLLWDYPQDCLPPSYRIEVDTSPDFSDPTHNGATGHPFSRWAVGHPLEECQVYYWRVAAIRDGDTTLIIGPYSETRTFVTDSPSGACEPPTPSPTCDPADLQAVVQVAPAMWEVVDSLTPTLEWNYPDPSCTPEAYRISLASGPLFSDELGGGTGSPSTTWVPGSPLQPATEYAWRITPLVGSESGPPAGNAYFFTGPYCDDPTTMQAPTLVAPADGGSYDPLYDAGLLWEYPDSCLPSRYKVEIATDPDFSDIIIDNGTLIPSTRFGPEPILEDCRTYYWRVAPVMDTDSGAVVGPYSETRRFVIVSAGAACSTPTPRPFPRFHFEMNAFCRQGPGTGYPDRTAIPAGESVDVLGRDPSGNWYYINWGAYDVDCWVAGSTGRLEGLLEAVPIMTPPPLPPTPSDNSGPTITDLHALQSNFTCPNGYTQTLEVGARISDPSGVSESNTHMRVRVVPNGAEPAAWQNVPVHDRAMGNQYGFVDTITLPPGGGQVEYQIVAVDTLGNTTYSPVQSVPYKCK